MAHRPVAAVVAFGASWPRRLHRYKYSDYAALELQSPTKHEFVYGEIYAMAGGSEEHSALAAETLRLLGNAIGDRPCRVQHLGPVHLRRGGRGRDISRRRRDLRAARATPASPVATAVNPQVLVEVTSDSSEEYDNVEKFAYY